MKPWLFAGWLAAVWVALWGDLTFANVAGGALVAGAVLTAFPTAGPRRGQMPRIGAALYFLGYFLKELVASNALVAWEVLTPGSRIREGIIAVPLHGAGDAVTTLVADAITLTPGTLTLDTQRVGDDRVLYVHVLHLHDVEQVRADIQYLGYLALRAFGSRQVRASLTNPRTGGRVK